MNIKDKGRTIILADSNTHESATLATTLEESGFVITLANTISEIIPELSKGNNIVCVLIDLQLIKTSIENDLNLLKQAVNEDEIPVVILADDPSDIDDALKDAGFDLVDILKRSDSSTVIKNKIKIFNSINNSKNRLNKKAEDERSQSLQLQHLVQVVAHDLKSPLSTSIFLLSILKDDERINEMGNGIREHVHKIYKTNVHLAEMINLAADHILSNLKDQKKEITDTGDMLHRIIKSIAKDNTESFKLEGSFPILFTNKLKLNCIFEHLLHDVNKYAAENILIGVHDRDNFYEFYIIYDASFKIPDLKKIFMVSEDNGEGTDAVNKIALNIPKMLVEEQFGEIRIEKTSSEKNILSFEWRK